MTTQFTTEDAYLFAEGTHCDLGTKLGAHVGPDGTYFAVWAPNARAVSVTGEFNDWNPKAHPLASDPSGVWRGMVPTAKAGDRYKYFVGTGKTGQWKADPFGFHHEVPPETASVVWPLDYDWDDAAWMKSRGRRQRADQPMSVYEVHLGSWKRAPDGNWLSYREIAPLLAEYCVELGFTHVELLPVMEHPFFGSWGYQTTGYFAPSSRFGTPQDFKFLVDTLHQAGIGVILDWVPSHFPEDAHGLATFDGTKLFEHADPRQGFHPDWKSAIYNYGRNEVRSFLISSAMFWIDEYHVDGLRVDAVASMLYLDYSRAEGEWIPNVHGGRENLEAIQFLRELNVTLYGRHPDIVVIAEESTAWPLVSRPVFAGGLGFGMKWDMGWMHDTLRYLAHDPVHRKFHHHDLTFRAMYQFTENFMVPLSHDEVVHGKGSLYGRMPGDDWQKRANVRLLFAHQWASPGKKLLFMGCEFAQPREWAHDEELTWPLLGDAGHAGIQKLVGELNRMMTSHAALHATDFDPDGFRWMCVDDADRSITAFARKHGKQTVLCIFNNTPVLWSDVWIAVPKHGAWREILNTDDVRFGGSGAGHFGEQWSRKRPVRGQTHSITVDLPPLGALFLANGR